MKLIYLVYGKTCVQRSIYRLVTDTTRHCLHVCQRSDNSGQERIIFGGASVRDIVQAAGVPQGSFTNHFASKEAFCLEILDLYFKDVRAMIQRTLRNDSLPPLKRLRTFVDAQIKYLNRIGWRNGCLIGNFSAEASEHSEAIRKRLVEIYEEMRQAVAYCLKAAVKIGEVPQKTECDELAGFLIASLQGAILQSKTERNAVPLERFQHFIFSTLMR